MDTQLGPTKKITPMSAKKSPRKQYGRRGSGKTQTSLSLPDMVLEVAQETAEAQGRSFSNYITRLLERQLAEKLAEKAKELEVAET